MNNLNSKKTSLTERFAKKKKHVVPYYPVENGNSEKNTIALIMDILTNKKDPSIFYDRLISMNDYIYTYIIGYLDVISILNIQCTNKTLYNKTLYHKVWQSICERDFGYIVKEYVHDNRVFYYIYKGIYINHVYKADRVKKAFSSNTKINGFLYYLIINLIFFKNHKDEILLDTNGSKIPLITQYVSYDFKEDSLWISDVFLNYKILNSYNYKFDTTNYQTKSIIRGYQDNVIVTRVSNEDANHKNVYVFDLPKENKLCKNQFLTPLLSLRIPASSKSSLSSTTELLFSLPSPFAWLNSPLQSQLLSISSTYDSIQKLKYDKVDGNLNTILINNTKNILDGFELLDFYVLNRDGIRYIVIGINSKKHTIYMDIQLDHHQIFIKEIQEKFQFIEYISDSDTILLICSCIQNNSYIIKLNRHNHCNNNELNIENIPNIKNIPKSLFIIKANTYLVYEDYIQEYDINMSLISKLHKPEWCYKWSVISNNDHNDLNIIMQSIIDFNFIYYKNVMALDFTYDMIKTLNATAKYIRYEYIPNRIWDLCNKISFIEYNRGIFTNHIRFINNVDNNNNGNHHLPHHHHHDESLFKFKLPPKNDNPNNIYYDGGKLLIKLDWKGIYLYIDFNFSIRIGKKIKCLDDSFEFHHPRLWFDTVIIEGFDRYNNYGLDFDFSFQEDSDNDSSFQSISMIICSFYSSSL